MARRYSLKRRLLIRMGAIFIIALLLLGVGIWRYAERAADYSFDRLLTGASLSILERVFVTNEGIEVDMPYSTMSMLSLAPEDRAFYQVLGPDGFPLTGYPDLPLPEHWKPGNEPVFFNARYSGETVRFLLQSKLLTEQGIHGWVTVQIGQTRIARTALTWEVFLNALGLLLLIMSLGLLFVWFGIGRALRPLGLISQDLRNRAPAQLSPLEVPAPKEIAPLVNSLNTFMRRLQGNLNLMQNFIADAAHQIRTPLSTLQVQLDMAEHEQDNAALKRRLSKARELSKRLIRLTNQLLAHALVIHRGDTQTLARVNLTELGRQVLTEAVRDHAHTAVDFGYDTNVQAAWIQGDTISLKEALRNLLDNAVKYGPADNQITLAVHAQNGQLQISVEDRGPGIPTAQHQQVQQRFERLAEDRAGSGLGLAIVRAVADAHQADMTLSNGESGGLKVTLSFPAAEQE
ncbi:sensor histidine kinase [Pokkaliibacter plantistimulans]|uniref:histidine kinase n=1 Tax=Proteobacteria bacterium 228 TaxID=2083153 RepID=A0A2S5KN69_9PROT|nr:sensor histidine kinase [Pokkaliibacter plantistimulans]PPC75969.1 sensor histidine kinase [Pokkaliibacter plantistimulans]